MEKLGLYFHIPFCNNKCRYCDFDSYVSKYDERKVYVDSLIKEIQLAKQSYDLNKYEINTVFIGGGTPTALDEDLLAKLLFEIDSNFCFSKDLEYSIEINPNSISEEKIRIIKNSKVNRISIGLQSTNKNELNSLGRTHSFEDFKKTYTTLRKYGFDNINVDLMMGIPNQSINSYRENLQEVIELNPEHISAYMLIVEEGTPFFEMYEKGIYNVDEDLTLELYDLTVDFLSQNGYNQYEISNFAKQGRECRHNIRYWQIDEYLGFGRSASSYFGGKRFTNASDKYVELMRRDVLPIEESQVQTEQDLYEEWIFLKLRMNYGIVIDEIDSRFNMNFREKFKEQLEDLYSRNLINPCDERLSLTRAGIKISNSIYLEFM